MKCALYLDGLQDISPSRIDHDPYAVFMQSVQLEPRSHPTVFPHVFKVQPHFHSSMVQSITAMKVKKLPGSDFIRPDTFRLDPELFVDATLALWEALGWVA